MKTRMFSLVVVLFASNVFAQTAVNETLVVANQDTTMGVGGPVLSKSPITVSSSSEGGDSTSDATATATAQGGTSISGGNAQVFNFDQNFEATKPKTPLASMGFPGTAWWMPSKDQVAFWNALAAEIEYYMRTWTREDDDTILKDNNVLRKRYPRSGSYRGYKWVTAIRKHGEPVDDVEVRIGRIVMNTPNGQVVIGNAPQEVLKDHDFLGGISITGEKGKSQDIGFALIRRIARDQGIDMITVSLEINTVYTGKNISPASSAASAATNFSVSLIGGISSTTTAGRGEIVIKIGAFRRNGSVQAPPSLGNVRPPTKPGSEDKKDELKKVPPPAIRSSESSDRRIWGVQTSPEARNKARLEDIVRVSPSF